MADITDDSIQQSLRTMVLEQTDIKSDLRSVHEEVASIRNDMRTIIREETASIRNDMRAIVQEETADMRDDIATLKQVQGQQGIVLRTIQLDVGSLKTSYRKQASETRKLGILFEDLEDRFQASSEAK